MPKKQDTVTTLDMGSRKVTVVSSLQYDPWYCKLHSHSSIVSSHSLRPEQLFGQGRLSHLGPVHEPVHLYVHSESRFALPSRHEECRGQWGQLRMLQPGPPTSRCTHSSSWMLCRTSPCRGRAHFQDNGHCNWIRTTPRDTHRSRRKHYRYQRNNHTELAERRRARRRLLWSHIASRDNHPIFLVRGSCRVHSVDGGCRFSLTSSL